MQASPLGRDLYGGGTGWGRETFRKCWPVPAAVAFKTTDGHWVQNLGVDTPTHLPKLLSALPGSKFKVVLGAPLALLTAAYRWALGQHKLEMIRAVTEMVNGVILATFEEMSLAEFEEWSKKSGWDFWAQIKTVDEAKVDRNTKALECIADTAGVQIGTAPVNLTQNTLAARL